MLTAALFITAGTRDQLTCPSTGERANGGQQTHAIRVVTQPRPGVKGRYTCSVPGARAERTERDRRATYGMDTKLGTGRRSAGRCTRELSEVRGMLRISGCESLRWTTVKTCGTAQLRFAFQCVYIIFQRRKLYA